MPFRHELAGFITEHEFTRFLVDISLNAVSIYRNHNRKTFSGVPFNIMSISGKVAKIYSYMRRDDVPHTYTENASSDRIYKMHFLAYNLPYLITG